MRIPTENLSRRVMIPCLLILALAAASGCTVERLVRDNVVPECPGQSDKATSRAAACMTSAMYEIAQEKDDSTNGTPRS